MSVVLALLVAVLAVAFAVASRAALVVWGLIAEHLATAVHLWDGAETVKERPPEWLLEVRQELDELLLKAGKQLREIKSQHASATHAIRRVRKELADSGGDPDERLDWLRDELGLEDGDGGDGSGVYPMRPELAPPPAPASAQPATGDWQALANARKFG